MIEELKRYEKKIRGESEPVYDHRMFVQNQKRVYQQMDGIENINNENQMLKRVNILGVTYGIMRKNMKEMQNGSEQKKTI